MSAVLHAKGRAGSLPACRQAREFSPLENKVFVLSWNMIQMASSVTL